MDRAVKILQRVKTALGILSGSDLRPELFESKLRSLQAGMHRGGRGGRLIL